MSCVAQSENGWVPAQHSASPSLSATGASSASVASRSARASATVEQIPVTSSMFDSISSFLALGWGSPRSFSSRRSISLAPLRSSRERRSTIWSSTSTPSVERSEALKRMSTSGAYQPQPFLKTRSASSAGNIRVTPAKQCVVNLTPDSAPTSGRVRMEGNTAWVLASAALVLFMTPGLAFFYGGMVRSKNVLGMLMQNFFCMGLVSVLWTLFVFSLAFGGTGRYIGHFGFVGLKTLGNIKTVIPSYHGDFALAVPALAF